MIFLDKHIEKLQHISNRLLLVAFAVFCTFNIQGLIGQTSKQELWNNIDLVHPNVKVLSKDSKKNRQSPFKGGSKVLIPIGGALVVGTGIFYLANRENDDCPDTAANADLLILDCGGTNSVNLFANDGGDDLVLESIDLSNLPKNIDAQVGEGVITLTGSSESSFQIPYSIRDECGDVDSSVIEVVFEGLPEIMAVPDSFEAFSDQSSTIFVLNNDIGLNLNVQAANAGSGSPVSIANNTIVYTPTIPDLEFDVISYQIIDDCGQTSSSSVSISFIDDSAVQAVNDVLETNCNSTVSFNVLSNDLGENLSLSLVSGAPTGISLNFDESGFITINGIGTESFTFQYLVENTSGESSNGSVSINVVSSEIFAQDDSYFTEGNQTLLFDPTGNDSGFAFSITDIIQPAEGGQVFESQSGNELSFSPTPGFSGIVSFSYTITDICNQVASANVQITVGDLSDLFANDDLFSASCNQSLTMNVIDNDLGASFNVVSIQNDSNVALVVNADNSITANNVGNTSFSFQYTITNNENVSAVATVMVDVLTETIQTVTDNLTTTETTAISINPLLNDIGANLQLISNTEPTNGGNLSQSGDVFTYTPPVGFTGETMFAYTVQDECGNTQDGLVVIIVQPDATNIIANNDAFLLPCNPNTALDLLANDQGDNLGISNISNVPGVVLLLQGDGTVLVQGTGISSFSFQYTVSDSNGNSAIANVDITVNQSPIAGASDSFSANFETSINLPVLTNDIGDQLSILSFNQADGGTLTLNTDNTFTFVPDAGFAGNTQFNYVIIDECGQSSEANVSILVLDSPDAVTASDDNFQLSCDPNNILDVLQNDTGTGLSIVSIDNSSNADVQIDSNGLQIQVSGDNLNTFSFNYTIQGSGGFSDQANVTVNVSLPQISAIDETFSSEPNSTVSVDPLLNDLGQGLSISTFDGSSNGGTLSEQNDGTLLFTPNAGFSGSTSFNYSIEDECGQLDDAQITFVVDSLPEIQAINDNILADCNSFVNFNLLSNDLGENLEITAINNNSGVTISDNGNGNISIDNVGTSDFSFTYDITNNFGQTASASVTVQIIFPDLFIADDSYSADFESGIVITPLQNDQGNNITISTFSQPENGEVQDLGNGTLSFTPDDDFSGTTSFSYTIEDACGQVSTANITIQVADCPIDATDNSFATQANESLVIDVTNDDLGVDLNIISFTQANDGTLNDLGNNLLEFVPDQGFSGTSAFTYTIENECGITQTASVTITIEDCSISAQDDLFMAQSGDLLVLDLLSNDSGSSIGISSFQQPSFGIVMDNGDGTLTYNAPSPFCVVDGFTYVIINDCGVTQSASVTIETITTETVLADDAYSTNSDQILLLNPLDNDMGDNLTITAISNVVGGTVNDLQNGQLQFIPDSDFTGTASFTYTVQNDCFLNASANVNIEVADCSLLALEDFASTESGSSITIEALINDVGNALQISSFTLPAVGTLVDNGDNTFTFTAPSPFCEETSFTYVVINDCNETATSTVSISTNGATLFAGDDNANTIEDTAVNIDILANDTFTGPINFVLAPASNGAVAINPDNTVTFTPNAGFTGTTVISYDLIDECGQTTSADIEITVGADDCDIIQVDDQFSVFVGESIEFEPLLNDNGSGLFIASFNQPSDGGVVSDSGNNLLSFTSDGSFTGTVQFDIVIENECGDQVMGVVTIDILECAINAEFQVSNSNCGSDDGSITITNITPIGNYDLSWSNGATGLNNDNIAAGTYTVTIADLDNPSCVLMQTIEVLEDDLVFLPQIGGTPPTCQSDGSLNIQTSAMTNGPIVIEILLNGSLIDIEQVAAGDPLNYDISAGGTYTLFAFDQSIGSQCSEVVDITLIQQTDILILDNTDTTLPSTGSTSDGEVTYSVQNSMGTSWTFDLNGTISMSSNPSFTFSGLNAGNYTLVVTDDNGCTGMVDFALTPIVPQAQNETFSWKASRLYTHPDLRRSEQLHLILPLLKSIAPTVEHPLISTSDFEKGEWSFQERLHVSTGISQATSERSYLYFELSNTQGQVTRIIDGQHYLPLQINHFQWAGAYQYFFDRRNRFYGEVGLLYQHVTIGRSAFSEKQNGTKLNPYLQLGVKWRLTESFGVESNVRLNEFDELDGSQNWEPRLQFGIFRNLF